MNSYFDILLQISLSLLMCWGVYVLFIRRIQQFGMQRLYLTASLLLSLLIPLLVSALDMAGPVPESWKHWFASAQLVGETGAVSANSSQVNPGPIFSWWHIVTAVYLAGITFRVFILFREAQTIRHLYSSARKEKHAGFTLLYSEFIVRPFSFFRLIFLRENMEPGEKGFTIRHESAHVTGNHSWDNLFFEVAKAALWFHPCMYMYKKYLNEVHEYLADREVIRNSESSKSYAHFLLEHTCQPDDRHLILGLSNKLITKRILMLSTPSLRPATYLYLLLLIPPGVLSFGACSMMDNEANPEKEPITEQSTEAAFTEHEGKMIRQVIWDGNESYTDDALTQLLGIYPGEVFDPVRLAQSFSYHPGATDISSLYMDNGHLYFSVQPEIVPVGSDRVDLAFTIYEGEVVKIGTVCLKSDDGLNVSIADLEVKPGQLFDRSALIAASKQLTEASGGMEVSVTPKPDPGNGTVDIDFEVILTED